MDSKSSISNEFDVVIVGAGQYGLALGYFLTRRRIPFVILDAAGRVGDSWRNRYDSLVLFSPNRYNSLPGMPFPGERNAYPSKDEVANYLEAYADAFKLPVRLHAPVLSVQANGTGFEVRSLGLTLKTKVVVVAAGAFQIPDIPIPSDGSIPYLHSASYKNPSSVIGEKILVVGAGNSAVQIAEELSRERNVSISMKGRARCIPQERLGKNFLWWAHHFGILFAKRGSFLSSLLGKTPLIGCRLRTLIREGKLRKLSATTAIDNGRVRFADGSSETFDFVVFATGFRRDISWIDEKSRGVFSIGIERGRRNSSGLLAGVGLDARDVAREIIDYLHEAA